jgi:prolipoprotein diacylglyceryl transferase
MFLSALVWNPPRFIFTIPGVNYSLTWYGLLFALGFFFGYFLVKSHLQYFLLSQGYSKKEAKNHATEQTERLSLFVGIATIIGARLGHVFFYSWPYFKQHPLDIFKIWHGGLASHGAVCAILIALVLYAITLPKELKKIMGFVFILVLIVTRTALAGFFIRLGNFINQEILGVPTSKPWGIVFLEPNMGMAGIPLHPVQLYEGLSYLCIALILRLLWKKTPLGQGFLSAFFFVTVFTSRFFLEYFKLPQSHLLEGTFSLNMGQILSIPCIVFGLCLLLISMKRKKASNA